MPEGRSGASAVDAERHSLPEAVFQITAAPRAAAPPGRRFLALGTHRGDDQDVIWLCRPAVTRTPASTARANALLLVRDEAQVRRRRGSETRTCPGRGSPRCSSAAGFTESPAGRASPASPRRRRAAPGQRRGDVPLGDRDPGAPRRTRSIICRTLLGPSLEGRCGGARARGGPCAAGTGGRRRRGKREGRDGAHSTFHSSVSRDEGSSSSGCGSWGPLPFRMAWPRRPRPRRDAPSLPRRRAGRGRSARPAATGATRRPTSRKGSQALTVAEAPLAGGPTWFVLAVPVQRLRRRRAASLPGACARASA